MSRLEQMRSQFQARSGLPRPTRSGIPTPKVGTAVPAASRVDNGDAVDGSIPNGRQTLGDVSSKHCNANGTNNRVLSSTPVPRNVASRPSTVPRQNGHAKMPVSAPRSGGVLTTTTTAHLKNLANARQANGSSSAPVSRLTGAVPKVPAKTVTPTVTRNSTPTIRKPAAAQAPKKDVESLTKAKAAEPATKPSAQPSKLQPKSSGTTTKSVASSEKRTTVPAATVKRPSSTVKAPLPTERPLGPNQERCDVCGRGFDRERIEKHRSICKKASSKKVKVFDATKMRTKGTEVEAYVKRGLHKKEIPVKKSNWRAAHEEFIQTVRQAKLMQEHLAKGGKLSDLPPPPPSSNPDYVQCPHCGRKFNESAAQRHIPRCKEVSTRKRPPAARK